MSAVNGWLAGLLCVLGVFCAPAVATATSTPIDDSGTIVLSPTVQMRWPAISTRHTNSATQVGSTTIKLRLNVTPWLRHAGRVFLVLPAQPPGPISAAWTTQGRLLPGKVTSGGRTLVFSGLISTRQLEDVLQLTLAVAGQQPQQIYALNFRFEMETF